MTYKVIVEPEALQDLRDIFTYITEQDSKNKAVNFLDELRANIASLETMPFRCRKSLYTKDDNTRDLIFKGYTIVYQIRKNKIHILTLFRQKAY